LDLFKSGLSYIYLINDCNVGALESRIRASREALGDYIAFLDHDDTYSDGFLRVMHQAAVEHGADVVECEINNVSQNGGFRFRRFDCGERRFGDEIVLQYLQGFSHNNLWNKLVLKECFDAAVLELSRDILTVNWNFFEDLLLTIAIYNNSHIYLGTCDTCYNYLQRSGSSSNPIALCKMAAAISQVAFVASYVNRKFGAVGSPRDLYLFHRRETQWALDHISCRLRLYRPRGCIEFANQVKYLIIAFMLKHRTMKVRWLAAKLASRR
jgi:glycosyltransferase involved in cell wall biosynthesis